MRYGDQGRDARGARVMSRREALARATYGVSGLLLLGARTGIAQPTGRKAGPRVSAVSTEPGVARAAVRLPGAAQPRSVCRGRSGVLVVGVTHDGDPVSWRSRDGRRWNRHDLHPPAAGQADVWGVAAHRDRYIAVGSLVQRRLASVWPDQAASGAQDDVTFTATRREPTVWWTRDGVDWAGHTLDAADARHAQLISVSCSGSRLVAVGSTLDADGVQGDGGLVLTSDDGERWRRGLLATVDRALPEGSLTGVAFAGDAWYATSSDMTGGAVWYSADASVWSVLPSSRRQFAGMTLQGIGVRGRRVLVAATSLADHGARYYASADGCRTWRALPPRIRASDRHRTTVTDLSVIDGEVVVVGTRGDAAIIEGGVADGRD